MSDHAGWPLYEVSLRGKRGLNHVHVGSLHAADAEMALHHARDLYTRRNEGVSIWVVAAADITASPNLRPVLPCRLVCEYPGCDASARSGEPTVAKRRCNSLVNNRLASLDWP